jgi:hypothetical protein
MPAAPLLQRRANTDAAQEHFLSSITGSDGDGETDAVHGQNTAHTTITTKTRLANAYTTVAALPPKSLRRRDALPQQLQNTVPTCAQSCLENYISQQYGNCLNSGFSCLCSQYSSQGYTIGELGFICLRGSCSSTTENEEAQVYDVCSAQSSAVSATHSTLTVLATTSSLAGGGLTTTTVTSTSSPVATSTSLQTLASSSSPITAAAATSTLGATSTQSSCSLTMSTSSAAAATSSSSASTSLTAGQAVGVSIAAFGGMAALIGVVYLITCLRRRKTQEAAKVDKRDSYDFIDDAPPRFSPFHHGYADPRGPLGGFAERRVELPSDKRHTEWYHNRFPGPFPEPYSHGKLAGQGTPVSLGIHQSNESTRTMSQLLPEKPGSTPPQPQHASPRPRSMRSPMTVFEEDRLSRVDSTQIPQMPGPPPPVQIAPARAVHRPQYASTYTRSPEEIQPLPLSIDIPRQARRSPTAFPPPPVPNDDIAIIDHRSSRVSKAKSGASTSAGSLLSYYASPEAGSIPSPGPLTSNPLGSPLTPTSLEPQRRMKPVPSLITVTKPTHPPPVSRQRSNSTGSNTSFETTDLDEPTPPEEEERQLSPVAEHSPIAGIRYPKIPRSSNQAVPRTPPAVQPSPRRLETESSGDDRKALPSQQRKRRSDERRSPKTPERRSTNASTLSGTTIAAKRRDESMDKRLVIDTSHSRAGSVAPCNRRSSPRDHGQRYSDEDDDEDARTLKSSPRSRPNSHRRNNSRQESPLKGYGRVTRTSGGTGGNNHGYSRSYQSPTNGLLTPEMAASPGMKLKRHEVDRPGLPQEVVVKSPLWEPKLTPSRRGDDLYLEVGIASPNSGIDGQMMPRAF